jgi:two-component system, NtrC family, response regulator AtoC
MSISSTLQTPPSAAFPARPAGEEGSEYLFLPGSSAAMARIHSHVQRFAWVNVPILLLGESGVGKEVYARRIHRLSPRGHRTFLKINCAALPADLLESELFGFEAGAFTGAVKAKPGMFELCNHGTIFLDEIGEIPPALQAKLLQVLQDRQFSRLGGRSLVTVDVRILAATNVDIHQALASKRFREDLYYRLSAFTLHIPPLRERREEIQPLLHHFVGKMGLRLGLPPKPLSPRVIEACMQYCWPGNVRELENFVKRLLVLDDEEAALGELQGEGAPRMEWPEGCPRPLRIQDPTDLKSLVRGLKEETEREAIRFALERYAGNRKEAARFLKISTKALLQKARRYRIVADPSLTLDAS